MDKNCKCEQEGILETIFKMQEELNNLTFKKHEVKDRFNRLLSMEHISVESKINTDISQGPNGDLNRWLCKFMKAMEEETKELQVELLWKWWSSDTLDMQNIRVELIDILHFLISLFICCGMDSEDILRIYKQKYELNIKRQKEGYSKATKNENDNRSIK